MEEVRKESEQLLKSLPRETRSDGIPMVLYKGCWYPSVFLLGVIAAERHFQAQDSDIILASLPKSGTTWLKALIYSIVNRQRYPPNLSPLLTTHPHDLIRFLEFEHCCLTDNLDQLPKPRIFSTHSHYSSLPHSTIKHPGCRIVYVCRNPLDSLVSYWHFLRAYRKELQGDMDVTFNKYCRGCHGFGPFWDSVLGYWKASLENPEKVLFIKYEDLKEDIVSQSKRLANFLGVPFTMEEEQQGLIQEIAELCSLQNLKGLQVNQIGVRLDPGLENLINLQVNQVGVRVGLVYQLMHISGKVRLEITSITFPYHDSRFGETNGAKICRLWLSLQLLLCCIQHPLNKLLSVV
ncbi:hypothetical protein FNV43_RR09486 [Rhamnella rubrinervis]|uniref:Sulfotransferase n=1 Tax=Rhamnella rubrinervis TaxID=2594499 RepID=A0A8K0HAW8_9ROSA|nr:hypothetical protein FNV43_RR09486 [Rhamnella rubrinervis]